jgi:hypothetical protein
MNMNEVSAVLRASRATSAAEKKPSQRRAQIQEACKQAMESAARGLTRVAHGLLDREGVTADGWRVGARP